MISAKSAHRMLRLIAISTLPLLVAGCLRICNSETSGGLKSDAALTAGGQGKATACDVLNEHDLRASRHDTTATQKLLFGLQRTKTENCSDDAGGRNVGE